MVVLVCQFDLHLMERPSSLKGKRHVVRSLKDRIRNKFGVAVAEVGSQDLLHRCALGIAGVSESQDALEPAVERIRSLIEGDGSVEIIQEAVYFERY
ncbi:MAG: DUF503 domain-containing protein [Armatimonadetes bacterium]|nr:DUF503 domain-containing protein [Armatimonadota bacterium]